MRLNIAIPEQNVSKPVLDAALESVTRLNEELLDEGQIPTFTEAVDQVRWKPEPPGAEHFDHAATVLGRKWGDCDDLAPWHAASLRASGVDPGARAVVRRSGPTRWHAIVERSDGQIEDPSIAAGMKASAGVRAATLPTMTTLSGVDGDEPLIELPQMAVRPRFDRDGCMVGWDARVDIPWHHSASEFGADVALATLRSDPVADQAVVGALRGAVRIADASGLVHPDAMDRADAMADVLEGWDYDEIAGVYGPEHADAAFQIVGAFWDDLADVASKVVSFVPGVGPIASTAIDVAHGVAKNISANDARKAAAKRARKRRKMAAAKKRARIARRAIITPPGADLSSFQFPKTAMRPFGLVYAFE